MWLGRDDVSTALETYMTQGDTKNQLTEKTSLSGPKKSDGQREHCMATKKGGGERRMFETEGGVFKSSRDEEGRGLKMGWKNSPKRSKFRSTGGARKTGKEV